MDALRFIAKPRAGSVYVMRHGRTVLDDEHRSDGWLDYPLSDDGRVGLMKAQQYLKMAPITKVFTSSLKRASETAHIIASGILKNPTEHMSEAARTWNLGILIGGKKKINKPQVTYFMDNPHEAPEMGESMNEFSQRWLPWILNKADQARKAKEDYLVVTSGSNLRCLSKYLTGSNDPYDLDEGGLIKMTCNGNAHTCEVVLGHKDNREDWS